MTKRKIGQSEFVALMASLISIAGLAIDALLPALDVIGLSVGLNDSIKNQQLIIIIFLGLGIGPLIFGPISDSLGRKPTVYMGFALFLFASFICINAPSINVMLFGRLLQGIALSAPRTISVAIIRDKYKGDFMARIMSFVSVVFTIVPMLAPAFGKWILDSYNWQSIFYAQMIIAVIISIWFWRRQPETLNIKSRIPFSSQKIIYDLLELFKFKRTFGYTIISGFILGSFLVYLSCAQQIFQEQYALKDEFPMIFAVLTIAITATLFLNGTLVVKFGMEKLVSVSLFVFFGVSTTYIILYFNGSNPSAITLFTFLSLQFFSIGFLFGNLSALAMEPIGHIAGIGAAITGFISTLLSVSVSIFIGKYITSSVLPLFVGFSICSLISIVIVFLLKIKNLTPPFFTSKL